MLSCALCNEQFSIRRDAWNHVHLGHEIPRAEVNDHIVERSQGEASALTSATYAKVVRGSGKAPAILLADWHHLIEGLQTSSLGFYDALDCALGRRQLPDAAGARVDYREAGLFSAKREYLRISRGSQAADICAAPFGSGFFVSWWLSEPLPSPAIPTFLAAATIIGIGRALNIPENAFGILQLAGLLVVLFFAIGAAMSLGEARWHGYFFVIPGVGFLWRKLFRPLTLYRYDTMLMFKKAIHHAVMEVVDGLTEAQGLRRLSDDERKPILRDFWRR